MRLEYKTGSKWAFMAWKDISWKGVLYLRRLHVFQCPWFAIMVHWIVDVDKQRHQHDHPVSMLSIVLRGWYVERRGYRSRMVRWLNWIPANTKHRIWAKAHNTVTLVICGPREREWGFYTEYGWIPWREYHRLYGGETS